MTRQAAVKRIQRELSKHVTLTDDYKIASDILRVVEDCYKPLKNEWDCKSTHVKRRGRDAIRD